MKNTKFIFVTGGVCSSLGKGIVASSLAAILKSGKKKVSIMKLDPYLNVDPGTMSPSQHGEVFVLDDGSETDLDLGHYERFINTPLIGESSISSGKIYKEVLEEEREGKYLGKTIQVVPHITNKIKEKIKKAALQTKSEILIVELGGTVGDLEGEPFLESLRQLKNEYGKNCLCAHLTLLPYLESSKELKTKPTQLSISELRKRGILADMIFCRSDMKITDDLLEKISFFCDVEKEAVIPSETAESIYEVPLKFLNYGVGDVLNKKLNLKIKNFNMNNWKKFVDKIYKSEKEVFVGIAKKYNKLDDSYISVVEALKSAGFSQSKKVKIISIDTEKIEKKDVDEIKKLKKVSGIVVPGGFGKRGIEGKIKIAEYCRKNKIPYLGICLGSHIMAIEFARNVLKIKDATSEEFNEKSKNKIIHFIPEQKNIRKKGATMRLGKFLCEISKNTKAFKIYKKEKTEERHRHRYEFNNNFLENFSGTDFVVSGKNPESGLVEIVENKNHPFMIAVQFHPEFKSRPLNPHPLFFEFIKKIK